MEYHNFPLQLRKISHYNQETKLKINYD
jgi:hypothetical protein